MYKVAVRLDIIEVDVLVVAFIMAQELTGVAQYLVAAFGTELIRPRFFVKAKQAIEIQKSRIDCQCNRFI